MSKELDVTFLRQAVDNSRKSFKEGNFPAGSVLVKNNEVISSEISSPYPGLFHADSKAVTMAFNKLGPLTDSTLYVGLEPCLMCTGVAYWAGVRRIVFAVRKSNVSGDYYETHSDTQSLVNSFNDKIEFIHIPEEEDNALQIIREWENKYLKS